jgi:hypothetical protein
MRIIPYHISILLAERYKDAYGAVMETASDAVVVDHLEAHPYLASNRGHINPFGRQLMNLRVSCEALLMELEAFCFLILPHAGLQGSSYPASSATV